MSHPRERFYSGLLALLFVFLAAPVGADPLTDFAERVESHLSDWKIESPKAPDEGSIILELSHTQETEAPLVVYLRPLGSAPQAFSETGRFQVFYQGKHLSPVQARALAQLVEAVKKEEGDLDGVQWEAVDAKAPGDGVEDWELPGEGRATSRAYHWGLWGLWLVFLALLASALWRAPRDRWAAQLSVLFAVSAVLRGLFGPWGPGDLRLNLAAIFEGSIDDRWGHAPVALFSLLHAIFPVTDTTIFLVQIALSSVVPVWMALALVEFGFTRKTSLWSAAVVSLHPLLFLFSATLNRQPLYLFVCFASIAMLISYLRHGGRLRMAVWLLGLAIAVQTRPEGAAVLVPMGACALLIDSHRRGLVLGLLGASAVASWFYLTNQIWLGIAEHTTPSWLDAFRLLGSMILFDPRFTPLLLIFAWAAGIGLALARRWRVAAVALVCIAGADVLWTFTQVAHHIVGFELQIASSRYQTLLLFPFLLGLAPAVQWVLELGSTQRRIAVVLAAGLGVATGVGPYRDVVQPSTIDHEYRFVRDTVQSLPQGAVVYSLKSMVWELGFVDVRRVVDFAGRRDVSWEELTAERCTGPMGEAPNAFYYHGSYCAEISRDAVYEGNAEIWGLDWTDYEERGDVCRALLAHVRGDPLIELTVPAKRLAWFGYATDTISLGFYRVPKAPCVAYPR